MGMARRDAPSGGVEVVTLKRAKNGAVAHLGERLNGIQEVVSSILISSTFLSVQRKRKTPVDNLFPNDVSWLAT